MAPSRATMMFRGYLLMRLPPMAPQHRADVTCVRHAPHGRLRITLALAVASFALAPALPAQNPSPRAGSEPLGTGSYSIRGSLRHADDHPAEMVKVHLLQLSGEPVTMAFTRPNGEFEFRSIPSGVYLIAVEEDGFEPIQERIQGRSDET